jgi:signal transduction histidine kinase
VRLDGDEHNVTFTVRDNGRGIAPAFAGHIFERFTQQDDGPHDRMLDWV